MSNAQDQLDVLYKLLINSPEGQKIELRNINVSIIYLGNPIFFILPNSSSEKGILVKVDRNILSQFLGEEKFNEFIDRLNKKENSVIVSKKPFLEDITIQGIIDEIIDPFTTDKNVRVIKTQKIAKSIKDDWRRGSIFFKGDDKSYLHINEGLRRRIAEGLKPYIHTSIFNYLAQEVNSQFVGGKEKFFGIIECEKCKEIEIYHAFEIANRLCDKRYCRKCSNSKYENLMEVPFSDTMLIDIFSEFTTFFDMYMNQGKIPPDSIINKLLKYSKLDHRLEVGVVYDYLRNEYKKRFQKNNFDIMVKLEDNIRQAEKNKIKFDEFLSHDDKFTSMQSYQTTTDIVLTFNSIDNKIKRNIQEFYYPNPYTTIETDEFLDFSNIEDIDFNAIINLYKDTFDLIGDHWFLANLAKVIKNAPIIENCITPDLYGSDLLSKTLRLTKKTDLYDIIDKTYNVKIRNAIAHPGRVIDKVNKEIQIYDKGNLVDTFKISDFLQSVNKLINFHQELTYVKYRLAMKKDKNFLMTGGILSFQPEFYTKPNEQEKPHLVINQLANFKDYESSNRDFWVDNIHLETIDENQGIRIYVKRKESVYFESPELRDCIYGKSSHIKEWIELVLKENCYIPIDIEVGEKELQWIPIKIPVYPLEGEHEVFIKSMYESGKIEISKELEEPLRKFVS
jgi:hypothetical protein